MFREAFATVAVGAVGAAGAHLAFSADGLAEIPERAAVAYMAAAEAAPCPVAPADLAAIYEIETGHGTHGGASADPVTGVVSPHILGPRLDGRSAAISYVPDSDGGRWDGDVEVDRAVGPGQFIPTTWEALGRDGDGDGVADPHDLDDAAASTATHLCGDGYDIADDQARRTAFRRYNGSGTAAEKYADKAMGIAARYAGDQAPTFDRQQGTVAGEPGLSAILDDGWFRLMGVRDTIGARLAEGGTPTLDAMWTAANAPLDTYIDDLAAGDLTVAGEAPRAGVEQVDGLELVELTPGCRVHVRVVDRFRGLIRAAAQDGLKLVPVSCFRTVDEQIVLRRAHCGESDYAVHEAPASDCTPPTARPGRSNHQRGLAVDFAGASDFGTRTGRWLTANVAAHGLHQLNSESWHVEARDVDVRAVAASSEGGVAVLGDSLAVGVAQHLAPVWVRAAEGERLDWCAGQAAAADWSGVGRLVVSCGVNDRGLAEGDYRSAVAAVLEQVPAGVEVVWVDAPSVPSLSSALGASGVRVLPVDPGTDGVHPTVDGYRALARQVS